MKNRSIIVAAVIFVLLSLMSAASNLQGPPSTDVGASALSTFKILYNLLGLVAAYGLLRRLRWGQALTLIIVALNLVEVAIALFSGELPAVAMVITGIFAALYILVAVLVLRNPSPTPSTTGA